MGDGEYLLVKRGLYYRPDRCGYTGIKSHAGRYPECDARPADGVVAIHQGDAPEYSEACFADLMMKDANAKLTAAEARATAAENRCAELEGAEQLTYVVQHSPNCPSPYLVRLPRGAIDMKPYHETGDAFGFGATFAEALSAALAALRPSVGEGGGE